MKNRPVGSNWGDYGGDALGRLHELTADVVLRAAAEIRTGIRFSLSLPLDYPGGNVLSPPRHPPVRQPVIRHGHPASDLPLSVRHAGATGVGNDDFVTLYTQYSTQWDALGHFGSHFDANQDGEAEITYYNGHYPAPDVEGMATMGLQGRGVMIDLHRKYGDERTVVTYAMLSDVMKEQGVVVEPGDIVCLHTGFAERILQWEKSPDPELIHKICSVLDGGDPELQQWLSENRIAALAADNHAVEGIPAVPRDSVTTYVPLHELCLFKLGIPLGEIWYLTELAAWLRENGRSRFFLTAPPLRMPGCVGSPVTPIATV